MYKKTALFSLLCVCISIGISIWAWLGLPDLERYPIHWDAQGKPNGYSTKGAVLFNLAQMPAISIFIAVVLYFTPKFEPKGENLFSSMRAYTLVWNALMILFTGLSIMYAKSYLNVSETHQSLTSPRYIVFGISALFIVLGNVLGKIRQNFTFGIRTPWTLSSNLSWEKTHRVSGRLFVLSGLIGIGAAIFLPVVVGILTFTGLILAIIVFVFVYSYRVWKSDPDKHT